MGRLARTFGRRVQSFVPGLTHVFPKPEDLANADLSKAGIHGKRSNILKLLAREVCSGELTFSGSVNLDEAISRIGSIRGISETAVHYIAMRALGEPDAFPFGSAARRIVFQGPSRISPAELRRISEAWRPWRAYAALHLCASNSHQIKIA